MLKPTTTLFVLTLAAATWAQTPKPPTDVLDGVDPVLLVQGKEVPGKEVPGKEALAVVHNGYRYLFSTSETKAAFESEPERFAPRYGGTCARMGRTTAGQPGLFAVHDGRIYLFGSDACYQAFKASPERFVEPAPTRASPSAEATERGLKLLDKAAGTLGGAKLADLMAYRVELTRERPGPSGNIRVSEEVTVAFPDRYREERRMPFGTVVSVATSSEAFSVMTRQNTVTSDERPQAQRDALRDHLRQEMSRSFLTLVRGRRDSGVVVAATGSGRVGETAIENVRIDAPWASVTLGIDPASGRVLRETFSDRGPQGTFGGVSLEFSDFRSVEGVTLPFAVHATFDAQPSPRQDYTVSSWTLNPMLSADLFDRPVEAVVGGARE